MKLSNRSTEGYVSKLNKQMWKHSLSTALPDADNPRPFTNPH